MSDKPEPPVVPDWVEKMMPGPADTEGVTPGDGSPLEMGQPVDQAHPFLSPVKSSNISGVAHDGQALWVKFQNGTLYRYPTAGADLHTGLLAAESAGSYFHKHVRNVHQGERVI